MLRNLGSWWLICYLTAFLKRLTRGVRATLTKRRGRQHRGITPVSSYLHAPWSTESLHLSCPVFLENERGLSELVTEERSLGKHCVAGPQMLVARVRESQSKRCSCFSHSCTPVQPAIRVTSCTLKLQKRSQWLQIVASDWPNDKSLKATSQREHISAHWCGYLSLSVHWVTLFHV